jgi:hypothetical protein
MMTMTAGDGTLYDEQRHNGSPVALPPFREDA